ncbi:unnamed protein product [Leptidea sinapis]|uniref:Uncharacterized protein n=1 Tax=Leptidea sinapis TaxID=189913 RepID=A0A5E4Q2R7_9NEOP|nr:unnamed protein product [Leptidea sinapis]
MTSPRRLKKSGQCLIQQVDWDSPSTQTGTVKRRSSCPESSTKTSVTKNSNDTIFEVNTSSDTESGTSKSIGESDHSDSLVEVEQRISCIINENRTSQSTSDSSDIDIVLDNIFDETFEQNVRTCKYEVTPHDDSKTLIKKQVGVERKNSENAAIVKKSKVVLKTPTQVKKLNKNIKTETTSTILPVFRSTVHGQNFSINDEKSKRKVISKLKIPFTPSKAMEKPKSNFISDKKSLEESKTSLLSSPLRRTISNEYVRLKFTNDTVVRRTIDGKCIPKITPKIQSIIPESPVDTEDPFLSLSPNKKYTVTVNNKVRCDKDNYVIFDPKTGFNPDQIGKPSRIPSKVSPSDKSKFSQQTSVSDKICSARNQVNSSDTDSGILSPNSPSEFKKQAHYVNAAVFSEAAKKCTSASDLEITIVDPAVAKKATEQIKVCNIYYFIPTVNSG